MSVHSLKDLEKAFPSVAGINSMQVKDYLQAMLDENQVRCEKIGSSNWYWSFTSDAIKSKESIIKNLSLEESKQLDSIADSERLIEEEVAKREEDDEMLGDNDMNRKALMEAHDTLLKDIEVLDKQLAAYSDNDPTQFLRKEEETKKLKESAMRWTDNIEAMECLFLSLVNDRAQVGEIMKRACGDEYIVGEGLKDL